MIDLIIFTQGGVRIPISKVFPEGVDYGNPEAVLTRLSELKYEWTFNASNASEMTVWAIQDIRVRIRKAFAEERNIYFKGVVFRADDRDELFESLNGCLSESPSLLCVEEDTQEGLVIHVEAFQEEPEDEEEAA